MKTKMKNSSNAGFTLIELVVVIGILAVLFAIVLIAINPGKQFKAANDTKRRSDVNAILNAVYSYAADKQGALPSGIGTSDTPIADVTGGAGVSFCTDLAPVFIANLPYDPKNTDIGCSATYNTGYTIMQGTSGRITVKAPNAESGTPISVTR